MAEARGLERTRVKTGRQLSVHRRACAFLSFCLSFFLPFAPLIRSLSLSRSRFEFSTLSWTTRARVTVLVLSFPLVSPLFLSSLASLTTRAAPRDLCKHRPIHWATCSYIGGGDVEQKRAERSVTDASLWFNEWPRSIDPRDSAAVHPVIILPLQLSVTSLSLYSFPFSFSLPLPLSLSLSFFGFVCLFNK